MPAGSGQCRVCPRANESHECPPIETMLSERYHGIGQAVLADGFADIMKDAELDRRGCQLKFSHLRNRMYGTVVFAVARALLARRKRRDASRC
jgi:hypothetical protein